LPQSRNISWKLKGQTKQKKKWLVARGDEWCYTRRSRSSDLLAGHSVTLLYLIFSNWSGIVPSFLHTSRFTKVENFQKPKPLPPFLFSFFATLSIPPMISEPASSLRKSNFQDRRLSIIDVSSADDSLLDGNPLSHQRSGYLSLLFSFNCKRHHLFSIVCRFMHPSRSNKTHSDLPFQRTKSRPMCCTRRTRRSSKTPPPNSNNGTTSLTPTTHPESENLRKTANAICARV